MEVFGWWLPPGITTFWAIRVAKQWGGVMLGRILGKRYRSIRDTLVPFRKDQGRGDLAACLVEIAPDFKKATGVFNDCRYDANPRALDLLYAGMVDRLRKEGLTTETRIFIKREGIEDIEDKEIDEIVLEIKDIYSSELAEKPKNIPKDLIPLNEGISMVREILKNEIEMLQGEDFQGHAFFKFILDDIIDEVYATNPPVTTLEIINNIHNYSFSEDGTSAFHVHDEMDVLKDLQVRRSSVRKMVGNYLNKMDEEIQQNEEASTDG